jgi:large repetitive protein
MAIKAAQFCIKPTLFVAWLCLVFFAITLPRLAIADAVAGKALYESAGVQGCSSAGCHGAAPGANLPRILHAAKAPNVISNAIAGGMGGLVAANFSAQNLIDLADYIDTKITNSVNFSSVPFNPGGAGTPAATVLTPTAPDFILPSAYGAFTVLSAVNANGATASFTGTTGSYIAPVGQCSNATFTYQATGGTIANRSSIRIGNVTIVNPTAPSATNSSSTIAYNTSATIVLLSLSGTAATGITITQQPSVGSVSVSGLAVSYTASNTAFASPVTFKYRAAGPCSTQSGEATVTLTINSLPAPVITSALAVNGTGGQAFSYQITANNAPTSFNVTGALPPGLVFNGTSTISGTPTATGSFPITVSATNATSTTNQVTTITIGSVIPVVNSLPNANGTSGQAFSYQITATNLPTSFGVTGTLPTGVSVNAATGLISGTPVVASSTVFNVTLNATNSAGTGSLPLAISVSLNAPAVTSAGTASGTVGQAFSYQITGTDFPTSYAATGLPAGLLLNTNTGLISGTPTVQGTFNATVSAINGAGTSAPRPIVITIVLLAPVISSGASASGTVGVPLSYQIAASGTPTSFSGTSLPPGLSINTTTGLISGSPAAVGTFAATVNATNATGTGSATVIFSIANVPLPGVGGLSVSTAFNTPVAINLAPAVSGNFTSVAIVAQPANGTVVLNGLNATYTPKPGFFGTDSFSYAATGQGGTSTPAAVTITVATPPVPVLTALTVTVPFNKPGTIDLASGIAGVFTSITIVTAPAQGTATLNGTILSYTPNKGYFGADSFTFTATGPGGTSQTGTVNIIHPAAQCCYHA